MNLSSEIVVLYRGLAVSTEDAGTVPRRILENGLRGDEGQWRLPLNDLRGRISSLFAKPDLSTVDTDDRASQFFTICACGDANGATYYACKHNRSSTNIAPLAIEFEAAVDDVFVDGRDFLYPAFQFWDRETADAFRSQLEALSHIFGDAVEPYFRKAASSKSQSYRVAVCRLACQDREVLEAHARNCRLIQGRYGTMFCSAFQVRVPVPAHSIKAVTAAVFPSGQPWLTLANLLSGDISCL
jgi:hypothetical protein